MTKNFFPKLEQNDNIVSPFAKLDRKICEQNKQFIGSIAIFLISVFLIAYHNGSKMAEFNPFTDEQLGMLEQNELRQLKPWQNAIDLCRKKLVGPTQFIDPNKPNSIRPSELRLKMLSGTTICVLENQTPY